MQEKHDMHHISRKNIMAGRDQLLVEVIRNDFIEKLKFELILKR